MTTLKDRVLAVGIIGLTILAAGIIILGNQRQAHAASLGSQIVCLVYSDLNAFGTPIPVLSAQGCDATSTPSGGGVLEIIKTVVGTSTPSSDFNIHVKVGTNDIAGSPVMASATGVSFIGLSTGAYAVSEESNTAGVDLSDYTASFDSGCPAGVAVVAAGATTTCTITNTWNSGGGSGGTASDISVTKTVDDSTPNAGDTVTYTITVSNAGPANASGVLVTDLLPVGLTYVSDDGGGSYNHVSGTWTIGTLNDGSSVILHVTATVNSGTGGETITNTASATDANGDPNAANNTASAGITVNSGGGGGGSSTGTLEIDKIFGTGTTTPSLFSFSINGGSPISFNSNGINDITASAGTYSVTETASSTYTPSYNNCTSVSVSAGATTTCIITNNLASAGVTSTTTSDISVTKTVDDSTPNGGDSVTYTITASDTGVDATGVVVQDVLPSGITFVSTSSADTIGVYDPISGNWTIGDLSSTTPASLHIMATVNSGQSNGTVITNTATVTSGDTSSNSSNNSSSAPITVTIPSSNGGGGSNNGGGGGNGPIFGSYGGGNGPIPTGEVLGASTSSLPIVPCSQFLTAFIRLGGNNDVSQVTRLQQFLDQFESDDLVVNGVYNQPTYQAVKAFQSKYASDILAPWGETVPTGYVYLTTRKEVNEIYCNFTQQFPLTAAQEAQIDAYKSGSGGTSGGTGPQGEKHNTSSGVNTSSSNTGTSGENSQNTQTNPGISEVGAAGVTQSGNGIWGGIKNFFSHLFHH